MTAYTLPSSLALQANKDDLGSRAIAGFMEVVGHGVSTVVHMCALNRTSFTKATSCATWATWEQQCGVTGYCGEGLYGLHVTIKQFGSANVHPTCIQYAQFRIQIASNSPVRRWMDGFLDGNWMRIGHRLGRSLDGSWIACSHSVSTGTGMVC